MRASMISKPKRQFSYLFGLTEVIKDLLRENEDPPKTIFQGLNLYIKFYSRLLPEILKHTKGHIETYLVEEFPRQTDPLKNGNNRWIIGLIYGSILHILIKHLKCRPGKNLLKPLADDYQWGNRWIYLWLGNLNICFHEETETEIKNYLINKISGKYCAVLMDIMTTNGYLLSGLPKIVFSLKRPPLLVQIAEEGEEENRRETLEIEKLLGVYNSDSKTITLYVLGFFWCLENVNWIDKTIICNCLTESRDRQEIVLDALFAVVLIHELGHWVSHVLQKPFIPAWEDDHFRNSDRNVVEGIAQLITHWVAEDVKGVFQSVFERLNRHQTPVYHYFRKYLHIPRPIMIQSVESLRKLGRAAECNDWDR